MYVYTFENAVNGVITTDSCDNMLTHISSAQLATLYCSAVAQHLTQYTATLHCNNALATILQHVYVKHNNVVAQHIVRTANKLTTKQLQELQNELTAYVAGVFEEFASSEAWRIDYLTAVKVEYCAEELCYKEVQETVEVYYGYEFDGKLELVAAQETDC